MRYLSDDGKVFNNESECVAHEKRLRDHEYECTVDKYMTAIQQKRKERAEIAREYNARIVKKDREIAELLREYNQAMQAHCVPVSLEEAIKRLI